MPATLLRRTVAATMFVALTLGVSAAPTASAAPVGPARPFGSHPVAYPAGTAAAPGGRAAADAATAAEYDEWKAAYLVAGCGTGRYYVDASSSVASGTRVVSEGQGYGMVITALMAGHDAAAQTIFDGLYRYALDHPSATDPALMAWRQDANCTSMPGDDSSATDGDLDIAYGLLLADTQWGSAGAIDYAGEARRIIAAIARSEINPETLLPKLGDWVLEGDPYWYGSRSSDLMADRFTAFEYATGEVFWGQVARASTALVLEMQERHAPETGLLPDFVVDTNTTPRPAPPGYLESPYDGDYNWNAVRVPWRLASSALLSGDASSGAAVGRITEWIATSTTGRADRIRAGYELDGVPLQSYGNLAFTAMFAAGAVTDARQQTWENTLWSAVRAAPPAGYYADTLALQAMLLISNNAWPPSTTNVAGVQRIGGANRYVVSASISASTFAPGVGTVYVASGEAFPDALSASAAAGAEGGPVLLVARDSVPDPIAAELTRLAPARVLVLGGTQAVSAAVLTRLAELAPAGAEVRRIGGADRFAVSAAVANETFADRSLRSAYVASGLAFPDALAGSAAAGAVGGPVLLTARDQVPAPIGGALDLLEPDGLVVLGGVNSVAPATFSALGRFAPATRLGGATRYDVAAAISRDTFAPGRIDTVYVASGETFPDALSGSATAIANHSPVLLVTRDQVPGAVATELDRLSPARIIVLGGTAAVSDAVAAELATHLRGQP